MDWAKPLPANQRPSQSRAAPSVLLSVRRFIAPSGPPPNIDSSDIIDWSRAALIGAWEALTIDDVHFGFEELLRELVGEHSTRDHGVYLVKAERVNRAEPAELRAVGDDHRPLRLRP